MKTLFSLVSLKVISFFIFAYTGLGYIKFDLINQSSMKILATYPWALTISVLTLVFIFYIRYIILEMKEKNNEEHSTELI